jgi:hypothetical protein
MSRFPFNEKRKDLIEFLDRIDRVCESLNKLNALLDKVDRHRIRVTQDAVSTAKLLKKTVSDLNSEIAPKPKQPDRFAGPSAAPAPDQYKLPSIEEYKPDKYK